MYFVAFLIGVLVGLVLCSILLSYLTYKREQVNIIVKDVEKKIESKKKKAKGSVYLPEDEDEVARKNHIKRNAAQGKDTPISELM